MTTTERPRIETAHVTNALTAAGFESAIHTTRTKRSGFHATKMNPWTIALSHHNHKNDQPYGETTRAMRDALTVAGFDVSHPPKSPVGDAGGVLLVRVPVGSTKGVDPAKEKTLTVTLPNGRTKSRSTKANYTHAVVSQSPDEGKTWGVMAWASSAENAQKVAREWNRRTPGSEIRVIPVDGATLAPVAPPAPVAAPAPTKPTESAMMTEWRRGKIAELNEEAQTFLADPTVTDADKLKLRGAFVLDPDHHMAADRLRNLEKVVSKVRNSERLPEPPAPDAAPVATVNVSVPFALVSEFRFLEADTFEPDPKHPDPDRQAFVDAVLAGRGSTMALTPEALRYLKNEALLNAMDTWQATIDGGGTDSEDGARARDLLKLGKKLERALAKL